MTDPMSVTGLALGVVSAVIQTYGAVMEIYDVYLGVKDFSSEYRDIRMGLMIERYRLELWGSLVLYDHGQEKKSLSQRDLAFWRLFELIFNTIMNALQQSHTTMENLGSHTKVPINDTSLDYELLENLSLSAREKPKLSIQGVNRKIKFILRDKGRMKYLIKQLCYWNDSLEKMRSQLEQESLRRQLRTEFTTKDASEMPQVEAAAVLLEHKDIEKLASARIIVDQGRDLEAPGIPRLATESLQPTHNSNVLQPPSTWDFHLDVQHLEWKQPPFATEQVRASAVYKGEEVVVDWRSCQDDTWRMTNPTDFKRRTENLTRILNSDLKPLNLSILHCVGYLNENKNFTGYAFRLPPHARPGQRPVTLHDLISRERDPRDLPDLGDRFELAKALVSTIFEIHHIGWMHKAICPRNIVFWPRESSGSETDITRPYIMGFDTSRPNQPNEFSETPMTRADDDHYRHPDYREPKSRSFQPSYDIYSLGVVLFEVGIWKNLSASTQRHASRPTLPTNRSDPNLIKRCMEKGPQMELRRHTGRRYGDAVAACLDHSLDFFWRDPPPYERQVALQRYLKQLQTKLVDAIAVCNA